MKQKELVNQSDISNLVKYSKTKAELKADQDKIDKLKHII